jgi:hypothetical protein
MAPLLLQQARTYLASSAPAELESGLQALLGYLESVGPADRPALLARLDDLSGGLSRVQKIMAAPFLRLGRNWLLESPNSELSQFIREFRSTIAETLQETAGAA